MRSVVLASLRTHTRRYVSAALAIVIAVAFIVVTDALASASRAGLIAGIELPYANADVVVSEVDGAGAARLVRRAERSGDSVSVLGRTVQPVSDDTGQIAERVEVGAVAADQSLRWQVLEAGRFATGAGEAVADVNDAKANGVSVGDELRIGSGSRALEVRVVGLVDSPSENVGASLYLPWADLTRWASTFYVDSIAYAGVENDSPAMIQRLESSTGGEVQSSAAFVEQRSADLSRGVNVLAVLLLLFAAIAIFVSVLVIANTFSILFAQRGRDFAMLRCVGATRRQVLRSVRVEALLLGVVASLIGLAVGVATGYGLVGLTRSLMDGAPLGEVSLSPVWLGAAFVVGVLVTSVASWLPTRRVVAVSPLAALRPDEEIDVRRAAGLLRVCLGAAAVLMGSVLLTAAISLESVHAMVAGGGAVFTGVLLLGPLLMPALIRLVGAMGGGLLGPAGRLAARNAVRHPRRTAATTASLIVGVTLTTAVLTGLASSRGAIDSEMAGQHPIDLTLTSTRAALPADLLDNVRATDGVADAARAPGATASISPGVGTVQVIAPPEDAASVTHADVVSPTAGEVLFPYDLAPDRETVKVSVEGRSVELRVRAGEGWGGAAVIAPSNLERLTADASDRAIWIRATEDADPEDLAGDLAAIGAPAEAELASGLANRAYVDKQLDVLTAAVVALLGIAVVIALIGIGNTLGLSVLERARENALLRALGLTRRQLRGSLATEAGLLSLVATLVGTTLGVTFAWVGVQTLVRPVVDAAPVVLPWTQLVLVVVVAGLAGLLSGVLPARRASRVPPAAGLALD